MNVDSKELKRHTENWLLFRRAVVFSCMGGVVLLCGLSLLLV